MAISCSKHRLGFQRIIVIVVVLLSYSYNPAFGQNQVLALEKKGRMLKTYTTGDYFSFLDSTKHWQYGILTKIWKDSFCVKPYMLKYEMLDTVKYDNACYSLNDIFAMPKPGIQIEDIQGPKNHDINRAAGHVHFYWIKAGWLFRALGLGYAGLNIFNSVVVKNQPVVWSELGYAAGVFLFGEVLKYTYKPYLRITKRYYLKIY